MNEIYEKSKEILSYKNSYWLDTMFEFIVLRESFLMKIGAEIEDGGVEVVIKKRMGYLYFILNLVLLCKGCICGQKNQIFIISLSLRREVMPSSIVLIKKPNIVIFYRNHVILI